MSTPPLAPQQPSLPPTTTEQQDLTTLGQRRINLIWERTQSLIAIFVVFSTMGAAAYGFVVGSAREVPNVLAGTLGMVIGFYFSRTNHAAIGSVGSKPPPEKYTGR